MAPRLMVANGLLPCLENWNEHQRDWQCKL
jgi:hypothetical protein